MARFLGTTLILSFLLLCAHSVAHADAVELLSFEHLGNLQAVGDFYNGGSSKAPNLGVSFSSNFYGLLSLDRGGSGNFTPDPSRTPAIFINGTTGSTVTGMMNATNGFSSGINFFYTAAFKETITVWSGANGTGTVLATIALSPNDSSCSGNYCNWTDIGLSFSGTAHSVTFTGAANGIGISDITLGQSKTAIPEPSSIFLMGTGLLGLLGYHGRRYWA